MRLISLREFQPSNPVELTLEARDALRALVPGLEVTPVPGSRDVYTLTPGSVIGAVAIGDLAVEIAPKLPIDRVLFLLSYGLDVATWNDAPFAMTVSESLVEVLIPVFRWHLERALRRGVLQGYRIEEMALTGVRGRIRFDEQVRKRFGLPLPLEVRFDEFTEDILENRVLLAAIDVLRRMPVRSDDSRRSLRRFEYALERVTLERYHPRDVPIISYTRLNEHYRGAVEWARLILRYGSVESRHGGAVATTVLFDMNDVFETFVRQALREELGLTNREFPPGAECPSLWLDVARLIRLEPDLSWWTRGVCRFVGDAKYKAVNVRGIKHADLYQLLAYTTAAQLAAGVLVYAAGEGQPVSHAVTYAGKMLHVRALELGGSIADIRREVRELAAVVKAMAVPLIADRTA